jgi:hypothetical protein
VPSHEGTDKRRPKVRLVLLAVVIGGAFIYSAFLVQRPAAIEVLTGSGVAILLFLPLYWIQDRSYRVVQRVAHQQRSTTSTVEELSHAVEDVQEQVRETNLRIDELGPATRELIAKRRDQDAGAISRFLEAPTWESTLDMFRAARQLNAVGGSVGSKIGTSGRWLFFGTGTRPARAAGYLPALEIYPDISDREDRRPSSLLWTPDENTQAFMSRVVDGLKRVGKYPGDLQFDASAIFRELGETVKSAIGFRHEGRDIGPVYAIVNPEWALTERGIESLYGPIVISRDSIEAGVDIEPPSWIGNPATPERDKFFADALALAQRFWA